MIRNLLSDKFFRDNAVFFIGSMVIAVLNYLYHPVLSRMMSVEEFGEVQAILSLTYLTGILLTAFGTVAVNIAANHGNHMDDAHRSSLSQMYRLAVFLVGSFALGILAVSPYLKEQLQFDSVLPFLPLVLILLLGIPYTFYSSYLRGVGRFGDVSISGILMAGGKLTFGFLLVAVGLGVFGAILALALANILAQVYVQIRSRKLGRLSLREKISFSGMFRGELSYGGLVLVALGYITFLYASDVIAVKYFFDPEAAGIYSGIATVARIIFFVTGSVSAVLLSAIKLDASREDNLAVLKKAFAIVLFLGMGTLLVFVLFSSSVVTILVGGRYAVAAELLPLAGLYIFLVSLVNLWYTYYLALRDRRIILVSAVSVSVTIGLLAFNHGSIPAILTDYALGTATALLLLVFDSFRLRRR